MASGRDGESALGALDPALDPAALQDRHDASAPLAAGPPLAPTAVLVSMTIAVAVVVGLALSSSPVIASTMVLGAAGLAAVVAAYHRFEVFVLGVLVGRASLDLFRGGGGTTGFEPGAALGVVLIALGGLALAARHRAGATAGASPVRAPMLLLLAVGAVSLVASERPAITLLELARMSAVVVMVLVLEHLLTDRTTVRRVLTAVFLSAVLPVAMGLVQVLRQEGLSLQGFNRVRGTFTHPNPFAIYLTFVLLMGIALLPHLGRRLQLALGALLAAAAGCLLFTYTRGAWLAALAGLAVVGILQSRVLLAGLLVGVVTLVSLVPSLVDRFSDLEQERRPSGATGNSLVWRYEYWRSALEQARENPVTGIGLKMVQARSEAAKNVHNDFVRVTVETGVAGLIAYLWLLVRLFRLARGSLAEAEPGLHRGVAVGFAGCLAAFLFVSASANVISQVVLLWYFMTFAVTAAAVARLGWAEPRAVVP